MDRDAYYLEYELNSGQRVMLRFPDENNRDGCHISLDMYKSQLGPVDEEVLLGILNKFKGEIATPSV